MQSSFQKVQVVLTSLLIVAEVQAEGALAGVLPDVLTALRSDCRMQ
jgi:hypothetical protein